MIYTCIGKRKVGKEIVSCTNTSPTPSKPERPEWGFLCSQCLGTQYGRPSVNVDLPDIDKPNAPELEAYEMEGFNPHFNDESEAEELADLRDLELDIDGIV